jgi:hypothetical protein
MFASAFLGCKPTVWCAVTLFHFSRPSQVCATCPQHSGARIDCRDGGVVALERLRMLIGYPFIKFVFGLVRYFSIGFKEGHCAVRS